MEAAAREIRRLLDHAAKNAGNPWPKRFNFTLTSVGALSSPNDIYAHINGTTQRDREENPPASRAARRASFTAMARSTAAIRAISPAICTITTCSTKERLACPAKSRCQPLGIGPSGRGPNFRQMLLRHSLKVFFPGGTLESVYLPRKSVAVC
jgi:hypothetical protein